MSGWITHVSGSQAHWVFITAGVVFGHVMMGLYYAIILQEKNNVFEKLLVDTVDMLNVSIESSDKERKFNTITLGFTLKNSSERLMYYSLKRADMSLVGRTSPTEVQSRIGVIPPHQTQNALLSTLNDVRFWDNVEGTINIEVHYGTSKEKLKYKMIYDGIPLIAMQVKNGNATVNMITSIKKVEHGLVCG